MKDKLLKILDEFYDLSEQEEEKILATILKMANSQPEEFIKIMRELEAIDYSILHEALAEDMENWSDFFLDELKRILKSAKETSHPVKTLVYLDEFINIDPEEFKHRDELINILRKELKNEHPAFRYWAINLITDFMKEGDYMTIKSLEKHLVDPDWRVRYWTYMILNEIKKPNKYKLSFIDKIRSKIFDPFKFVK